MALVLVASGCVTKSGTAVSEDIDVSDIKKITLRRGPCYDHCPAIIFELSADGLVKDSETAPRKDAKPVHRRGRIPRSVFRNLATQYKAIDFSPPKQRAPVMLVDHTNSSITVQRNGEEVVHLFRGQFPPKGLRQLREELMKLRESAAWKPVPEAAKAP